MFPAIPRPVVRPIRAEISWMEHISGSVRHVVHNSPSPNCAPTCEYVAIPDGSSSDAPVINPGPTRHNNETTLYDRPFLAGAGPSTLYAVLVKDMPPTKSKRGAIGWQF